MEPAPTIAIVVRSHIEKESRPKAVDRWLDCHYLGARSVICPFMRHSNLDRGLVERIGSDDSSERKVHRTRESRGRHDHGLYRSALRTAADLSHTTEPVGVAQA